MGTRNSHPQAWDRRCPLGDPGAKDVIERFSIPTSPRARRRARSLWLGKPPPIQVAEVAAEVAARMTRGLSDDHDDHDDLLDEEPLLSGLYGAVIQGQDALGPRQGERQGDGASLCVDFVLWGTASGNGARVFVRPIEVPGASRQKGERSHLRRSRGLR